MQLCSPCDSKSLASLGSIGQLETIMSLEQLVELRFED